MAATWADDILKCNFVNKYVLILIKISPNFVPMGPIDNKSPLVQVMAWRRKGDKPLHEPMMIQFNDASMSWNGLTLVKPKLCHYWWYHRSFWQPGGHLNIKMSSYQYGDSHVKDKTVSPTVLSLTWESPYLGKTVFILRRGPAVPPVTTKLASWWLPVLNGKTWSWQIFG